MRLISTLTIFIVVFAYAIIRYHILKGVSWEEFPLFISNKAISLSSVAFISLSYILGPLAQFFPKPFTPAKILRKYFGLLGFGLAAMHAVISLLIISPAYYPKFFLESDKMSFVGETSLLFGVLSFFIFSIVAIASAPSVAETMDSRKWLQIQHAGYFGIILVLLHVTIMGFEGWMKPAGWPGGLIPISMVAAIIIAFALLLKLSALLSMKNSK